MIPFPGESVAIGNAVDVSSGYDVTLYTDVVTRAGTRALAAGGQWRAWVYPGEVDYLEEAGADVAVSWVVEVTAGSGTVSAAWGFDPTYSDETAPTPNSLGSHAVTGPATLVLPTTLTANDVLNHDDAFHLRLDGVAGSLDVEQVKLRVWPSAGVAGGWSDLRDGFPTAWLDTAPWFASFAFDGAGDSLDVEASWDAAWASVAPTSSTSAPMTFASVAGIPLGGTVAQTRPGGTNYITEVNVGAMVALIPGRDWEGEFPIDPTLVEGVDWIRPPEEVAGDFDAYAQQVGDGFTEWDNATVTVTVEGEPRPLTGGVTFASTASDLAFTSGPGIITADVDLNLSGSVVADTSTADVQTTVPLATAGRVIVTHFGHSTLLAPPEWPGTAPGSLTPIEHSSVAGAYFGDLLTAEPVRSRAVLPPYRTWLPAVVPVLTVPPLRQRNRGRGRARLRAARQDSPRQRGFL